MRSFEGRTWVSHELSFFFQAEDGIRDYKVTGVQTCALPISASRRHCSAPLMDGQRPISSPVRRQPTHQPRASSAQTLMHGDGGRSSDSAASNALNYGGASPILQTPQDSSVQA